MSVAPSALTQGFDPSNTDSTYTDSNVNNGGNGEGSDFGPGTSSGYQNIGSPNATYNGTPINNQNFPDGLPTAQQPAGGYETNAQKNNIADTGSLFYQAANLIPTPVYQNVINPVADAINSAVSSLGFNPFQYPDFASIVSIATLLAGVVGVYYVVKTLKAA